jgi:hypothetical protein
MEVVNGQESSSSLNAFDSINSENLLNAENKKRANIEYVDSSGLVSTTTTDSGDKKRRRM